MLNPYYPETSLNLKFFIIFLIKDKHYGSHLPAIKIPNDKHVIEYILYNEYKSILFLDY